MLKRAHGHNFVDMYMYMYIAYTCMYIQCTQVLCSYVCAYTNNGVSTAIAGLKNDSTCHCADCCDYIKVLSAAVSLQPVILLYSSWKSKLWCFQTAARQLDCNCMRHAVSNKALHYRTLFPLRRRSAWKGSLPARGTRTTQRGDIRRTESVQHRDIPAQLYSLIATYIVLERSYSSLVAQWAALRSISRQDKPLPFFKFIAVVRCHSISLGSHISSYSQLSIGSTYSQPNPGPGLTQSQSSPRSQLHQCAFIQLHARPARAGYSRLWDQAVASTEGLGTTLWVWVSVGVAQVGQEGLQLHSIHDSLIHCGSDIMQLLLWHDQSSYISRVIVPSSHSASGW